MFSARRAIAFFTLAVAVVAAGASSAADLFYDLRLSDLDLQGQQIPTPDASTPRRSFRFSLPQQQIYAVLDCPGEVHVQSRGFETPSTQLVARAADNVDVSGRVFVPSAEGNGLQPIPFRIARSAAKSAAETNFYAVKLERLNELVQAQVPGSAWFRHQIGVTRQEMGRTRAEQLSPPGDRSRSAQLDTIGDAFDYLTGGRAMSENLQLDRLLLTRDATKADADTVAVASLKGISIAEIDWSKLNAGRTPKLDALAATIPADQHAVFFPTFNAFVRMIDEALAGSAPVLNMAEPRAEDARTLQCYQRQLCLSLSTVGRLLGPKVVKSVALTGSDPFFRTGTDLAILFETDEPAKLEALVQAQVAQGAVSQAGAKMVAGELEGIKYRGLRSPDRAVCVYVAQLPAKNKKSPGVIVSNSPYQLAQLGRVAAGEQPALASLAEFQFFRDRYPVGDAAETAFVFLSDATIRRWCGPRWRIAASRRVRDAAVMNELQAEHLHEVVRREGKAMPLDSDFRLATGGQLQLTAAGVTSSVLGTLGFQTPIAELTLDRVTDAEAEAYSRWRDGYETNWRWAFDPIGLRISLQDHETAADLTVMPLIAGTQYREFLELTRGAAIHAAAADPHDALLQLTIALDTKSRTLRQFADFGQTFGLGARVDPLSWLGGTVSVYLDDDPIWDRLAQAQPDEREKMLDENWFRAPLALQFEVRDALKLSAFLVGLRGAIDQTTAKMLHWENLEYREQTYVKISPARPGEGGIPDAAIYYAPTAKALIISLSEPVLKHAIDRQLASADESKAKPGAAPATATKNKPASGLLGGNLAMHVEARFVQLVSAALADHYQAAMQRLAWSNLPILNEWHRLYPDVDPVELHERVWHAQLVCPGGGKYVWNEPFQTMESTVYGHPGQPKDGPAMPPTLSQYASGDFGLTFENQGLRARAVLKRAAPDKQRQAE